MDVLASPRAMLKPPLPAALQRFGARGLRHDFHVATLDGLIAVIASAELTVARPVEPTQPPPDLSAFIRRHGRVLSASALVPLLDCLLKSTAGREAGVELKFTIAMDRPDANHGSRRRHAYEVCWQARRQGTATPITQSVVVPLTHGPRSERGENADVSLTVSVTTHARGVMEIADLIDVAETAAGALVMSGSTTGGASGSLTAPANALAAAAAQRLIDRDGLLSWQVEAAVTAKDGSVVHFAALDSLTCADVLSALN